MTLKDKTVNIRKSHRCFSCHRVFEKGAEMRYWVGIYEGDFNSVYSCRTCDEIMGHCEPDEYGYPTGFVHEMLDKGETPEQLLNRRWGGTIFVQ